MARGAVIFDAMWQAPDFRVLPRTAQCTYVQLCSSRDIDCLGILMMNMPWWSKACDEIDALDIHADLDSLEMGRFVFMDHDTNELFVRARMRSLEVWKNRNMLKNALASARSVRSEKIRVEVAAELRRLGNLDAADVAAELMGEEPLRNPSVTPSVTPAEPLRNPPTYTQTQAYTRGGSGGVKRPVCRKHVDNHAGPCAACGKRREWDELHAEQVLKEFSGKRSAVKKIRTSCVYCDENGMMEMADGTVARCTKHREAAL